MDQTQVVSCYGFNMKSKLRFFIVCIYVLYSLCTRCFKGFKRQKIMSSIYKEKKKHLFGNTRCRDKSILSAVGSKRKGGHVTKNCLGSCRNIVFTVALDLTTVRKLAPSSKLHAHRRRKVLGFLVNAHTPS